MSQTFHSFKRKLSYPAVTVAGASNGYASAGYVFALNDLPNYAEFTALYRQFMITYVKLHIVNRAVNLSLIESYNNNALGFPEIVYSVDHTDNTAPAASAAGMNTLRECGRSKGFLWTSSRRSCSVGQKPAILDSSYKGVASTAYSPKFNQWISTADPGTPHYGLKYCIRIPFDTGACPGDISFDVYATYYFRCRGTK